MQIEFFLLYIFNLTNNLFMLNVSDRWWDEFTKTRHWNLNFARNNQLAPKNKITDGCWEMRILNLQVKCGRFFVPVSCHHRDFLFSFLLSLSFLSFFNSNCVSRCRWWSLKLKKACDCYKQRHTVARC